MPIKRIGVLDLKRTVPEKDRSPNKRKNYCPFNGSYCRKECVFYEEALQTCLVKNAFIAWLIRSGAL